ncbi:MAG: lipopolysaccharide biosynthesis protein [bacterium]
MSTNADVKRALVSGSFWIAVSEVLKAIAELSSSVVAARVLSPQDFGLMGTVLLTISVLENFSRTGFDQALIQRQDEVEPYLNVAWTWHVIRGVGIAALLAVLAVPVSAFFDQPTLKYLVWAMTAQVVFQSAQNIGLVFFSRDLNFKTICVVNGLQAFASAGVAIPAVLYFQNVWGLVIGLIAGALVSTIVSFVAHPFRPRFAWDMGRFKELTRYGKWITGLSLIGFIVTQGDDIFVSKYLGLSALAFYQLAYSISNLPATKVTHVISRVSFPTYSRLQHDPEALRAAFVGVMRSTLLLSAPVSVGIWLATPGIVAHVVGDKWAAIIPLVEILVLSAFVRSFAALGGALFQACNRPDLDFKMNVPRFLALVVLLWPFTATWGLEGASWVVLIAISMCLPVWFFGVWKLTRLSPVEALLTNMPAAFCGGLLVVTWLAVERVAQASMDTGIVAFLVTIFVAVAAWLAALSAVGRVWPAVDLVAQIRRLR